MAVHVIQNNRRPWYEYLAEAGTQLLGGVIQNQFAKSAEKRAFQMEQEKAEAEMQRKLQYGDAVRERMLPTPGVNDDPVGFMNAYIQNSPFMTPEMIDNYDELTNVVFPQRTMTNTDLGDRNSRVVFDPRTGALDEAIQEYGLNPTKVYEQDAATRRTGMTEAGANGRARIAADTARYGAAKPFRIVQDENGNNVLVYADATSADLGIRSTPKSSGGDTWGAVREIAEKQPKRTSPWNSFKNFFGFGEPEDVIVPGDPNDDAVREFENAARGAGTTVNPFAARGVSDAAYSAAIAAGMTDEEIEEQLRAAGR